MTTLKLILIVELGYDEETDVPQIIEAVKGWLTQKRQIKIKNRAYQAEIWLIDELLEELKS
jgi:hypothetical protein